MTLMIVELLPWFAFAGAAFLLGWVGVDILLAKMRASKAKAPAPVTAESARGLVGDPEPFAEVEAEDEPESEPEPEQATEPVEADAKAEPEEEPEEAEELSETPNLNAKREQAPSTDDESTETSDEEESLEIPTSHAQDVAETPEESDNETSSDAAAEAETEETSEDTTSDEDESVLADVVMVRRDPSVRVFDAVVAPSSRKVRSTGG